MMGKKKGEGIMLETCPVCRISDPMPADAAEKNFVPGHLAFYGTAAKYFTEPFRIFGNLWYVGDKKVCSHLIDTGDGLILFDTGYRNATHLLLESIRRAGFDPADVKIIIHSHGHFDHFGGGNDFRLLFGSKIYMSRVDTELLRERPDRALTAWGPNPYEDICWPDAEIADGDHICLGNTDIRCVLAPGHTLGTMCFFFDVTDGKEKKRVGYWGGVGFLTVYRAYCRKFGLPEDKPERLLASIEKLWNEPVEIQLGNHPSQNCTLEKREWMLSHPGENPFVNPDGWHIFLFTLREKTEKLIELGY